MKRTILLISMLLAGTLLMAAVQQYTFSFDQPEIVLTDDQAVLIYENCHNMGNEGEPVLPQFNATMLLPQGEELQEVRIISTLYYPEPQNLQLKPAARQFPISVKQPDDYQVIPDKEIYNSSDPYPGKLITAENTHFLSGHSIAGFLICPVEFIPAIKQVRFLQEITVEMISDPSQRANAAQSLLRGDDMTVNRVDDLVENPSQRLSYLYQGQQRDEDYDLLLITSSELLPAFQEYLDFKMSTGFTVATEIVSDIYANYTGQDDAEKVRNCIIDYYQNHNIDYLILGGDSDGDNPNNVIVPHRGFSVLDDPTLPSDMYFSGLDGNWNSDGDNSWGESNEMDLYAEISVGRICVDSAQEIINATNKLMMYQNTPVVADIEKALMIGEELNDSPWTFGGDYKDEIANGSSNNGYTTVAIDPNFNINRLYERDIDWSKFDVFSEFNDFGVNLLNHLGHSNPTYNMKMNNNDLTTTNFTNDGINRGYVIGYSQGCYNGSFDNWHFSGYYTEDCFAEKFTTIETGEVASIANSRYGWYQPGGTNSSSQYYDRQFYDAIFGQEVTIIGDTNRRSKETDVTYMQYDSYFRWTAYELNLFGDPSMDIWTAEPIDIYTEYPVSIPIGSSTIQFMTDVPFARIALVQDGTLIGRCLTNETGTAVLETFEPIIEVDEIQVSIIAHNRNRHTGSIIVVSDQPYVIYDSYFINDSAGNDNQLPDFSEEILLDVDFYNVGNQPAENLTAVLVCDDEYVTITDQEEDLGNIPPGQIITFEAAFNFVIDDIITDQHRLDFTLSVTGDERETWNSYFSIFLNAPQLSAGSLEIDDYLGDDNGILDPGETALIMINTINSGHAATPPAIADLTCSNEMITITPVNTELGS
ncbi:MAG: hypothetical protein JW996_04940, partial [Candidatus Cloacimonetes bacterium]|nr:hypothetical protein [Candidatus Cloacimonadota bacterium]